MWNPKDLLYSVCSRVVNSGTLPKHVGFIMDGHRRYAKLRNMSVEWGYYYGTEITRDVVEWCFDLGIKEVTLFGFSIDNWARPPHEIQYVMDQTLRALNRMRVEERADGMRFHLLANMELLPPEMQKVWADCTIHRTVHKRGTMSVAFVYTSHEEITNVARSLAAGVADGVLYPEDVCQELVTDCLYGPKDSSPIDMIIRTSGEVRLSNFLLWQSSNACLYFTPILWPDFGRWNLLKAVLYYQRWLGEQDLLRQAEEQLREDRPTTLGALRGDAFARHVHRQRLEYAVKQIRPLEQEACTSRESSKSADFAEADSADRDREREGAAEDLSQVPAPC